MGNWEIFTRKVRRSGNPTVSFTTLGRIALNTIATAPFEKEAVEFVLVMWDSARHQIGVRPITKKDSRSYKVAYGKKGNGCGFSAKTFLDYIGYDYSETRSFPVKWDEPEAMYVVEVPEQHLKKGRQQQQLIAVGGKGR